MPTYCYTTKDGETHERFFQASQFRRRIRVNGKTAWLDVRAQQGTQRSGGHGWPRYSDALFATPEAQPEWRKKLAEGGVHGVEWNALGQMRLNSEAHQRRVMKALGARYTNAYC